MQTFAEPKLLVLTPEEYDLVGDHESELLEYVREAYIKKQDRSLFETSGHVKAALEDIREGCDRLNYLLSEKKLGAIAYDSEWQTGMSRLLKGTHYLSLVTGIDRQYCRQLKLNENYFSQKDSLKECWRNISYIYDFFQLSGLANPSADWTETHCQRLQLYLQQLLAFSQHYSSVVANQNSKQLPQG